MNSIATAVLDYSGETTITPPPLRQSVKTAIENYILHLDDQIPVNFHQLVIEEIEAPLIDVVMKHCNNNQSKAAKFLGLSRGTLRKKLKQYQLEK